MHCISEHTRNTGEVTFLIFNTSYSYYIIFIITVDLHGFTFLQDMNETWTHIDHVLTQIGQKLIDFCSDRKIISYGVERTTVVNSDNSGQGNINVCRSMWTYIIVVIIQD